jgi:hypothetical protein
MATPDRASTAALRSRVLALELRPNQIDTTEADQRFQAAVRALYDALEAFWPPDRPLVDINGQCLYSSTALAWLQRMEARTETDADRRAAAGIPPCHVTVHELLRACVESLALTQPEVDALLEREYGPHRARAPARR